MIGYFDSYGRRYCTPEMMAKICRPRVFHHTADEKLDLPAQRAWAVAQSGELLHAEIGAMSCPGLVTMDVTSYLLRRSPELRNLRREAARIARLIEGGE